MVVESPGLFGHLSKVPPFSLLSSLPSHLPRPMDSTILLLLALPVFAQAQHVHSSTDGSNSTIVMVPYLHFTPGDALLFREWVPRNAGPFTGACIGLFLLAMVDRWLAAMRRIAEVWWKQRLVLVPLLPWPILNSRIGLKQSYRNDLFL